MKIAAALASTGLALTMLTGCGGGGDDFCGQVEDLQGEFADIDGDAASIDTLADAGEQLGDLGENAPDDLSADFNEAADGINEFVGVLEDAGLPTDVPLDEAVQDIDPADLQDLSESATSIENLDDTFTSIEDGVQEECDIDLSDDPS